MGNRLPIVEEELIKHLVQIAPEITSVESERWVLIVDTVILVLTLLGAFFILGGMAANEIRKRASTTRMRLVQSLVMSDVIMGIVGLIGCCLTLDGKPLIGETAECDALGILFHAVIFSQHLWTLSLAFSTFMILTHPLHIVTSWIEKYWYWSWLMVWGISFTVSVVTFVIYGYEPAGGICYLGNNTGLYGELIQFVPRAVVFLCITFFYGRLYVFLRRPDKIRSGFSDNSHGESSYSKLKRSWGRPSRRRVPFLPHKHTKTVVLDAEGKRIGVDTSSSASKLSTTSISSNASIPAPGPKPKPPPLVAAKSFGKGSKVADDIPPWERVELPVFQIDGQKYGGALGNGRDQPTWSDWRFTSRRARPTSSTPNASTPVASPLASPTATRSFDHRSNPNPNPLPTILPTTLPKPITPTDYTFPKPVSSPTGTNFSGSSQILRAVAESRSGSDFTGFSNSTTVVGSGSESQGRRSSEVSGATVGNGSDVSRPPAAFIRDELRDGPTPLPSFNPYQRRGSLPTLGSEPLVSQLRRPSCCPPPALVLNSSRGVPSPNTAAGWSLRRDEQPSSTIDLEKGYILVEDDEPTTTPSPSPSTATTSPASNDDEDDWDLKRFLAAEDGPAGGNDPMTVTQKSESVEYVAESMASYLNRKTALLMLWFPLGYLVLFSSSLIHIIYDFAGDPPGEWRAISRWMILGQGLLNGTIYGIVEWHTKRVVRRRVRKGTFSPTTSHTGGNGSHIRAFSNPFRQNHSQNQSRPNEKRAQSPDPRASQLASRNRSPQVSFVDPEASIMQRLDAPKGTIPTLDED